MLIKKDYTQTEAYLNYGLLYRHEVRYTTFTDLDEFIHSPSGLYLPDVLDKLTEEQNMGSLRLVARNFLSRVCLKEQLAMDINKWVVLPRHALTFKNILLTRVFNDARVHTKAPANG